ncbi:MAG: hypothetical protein E6Q06_03755 [Candidatus Moraniibacteriota bacterium]|nr:MAG: hypothetical protein E6Q06_03755 [Candidatus Moranbacteria bacterium]
MIHINFALHGEVLYIFAAMFSSTILGLSARYIFWTGAKREDEKAAYGWPGMAYQFWFNFLGSAIGWVCFAVFLRAFFELKIDKLTFVHYIYLMTGGMGMAGLLPQALSIVSSATGDILQRMVRAALPDNKMPL